jgi:hypothetical protein
VHFISVKKMKGRDWYLLCKILYLKEMALQWYPSDLEKRPWHLYKTRQF